MGVNLLSSKFGVTGKGRAFRAGIAGGVLERGGNGGKSRGSRKNCGVSGESGSSVLNASNTAARFPEPILIYTELNDYKQIRVLRTKLKAT